MKKLIYISILSAVFISSCEDSNSNNEPDSVLYTMDLEDINCVEIVKNNNGETRVACDYLKKSIPFNSNGDTPIVSYTPGIEPYIWSALPLSDCIEDPESDGVYDDGDGCWDITFSYSYTSDSVFLKWEVEDLDLDLESYSYVGLNNNFWNSVYKIEK